MSYAKLSKLAHTRDARRVRLICELGTLSPSMPPPGDRKEVKVKPGDDHLWRCKWKAGILQEVG